MARTEDVKLYLLHRMPIVTAATDTSPGAAVEIYLCQMERALQAGFDGVMLPSSYSWRHSLAVDPFSVAARLLAMMPKGDVAIADIGLAFSSADEIIRRAAFAAAAGEGRLELGLSLGRPRDYWATNAHPAHARAIFADQLEAILWAFGHLEASDVISKMPAYRNFQKFPEGLALPTLFLSGTYCRENRQAINRHNLPYFSYGDVKDDEITASAQANRIAYFKVDLVGAAGAALSSFIGDPALFCAKGAPPCYFDAEEYRLRLQAALSPTSEVFSGDVAEITEKISHALDAAPAKAVVLDPCVPGLSYAELDVNISALHGKLLPMIRAIA